MGSEKSLEIFCGNSLIQNALDVLRAIGIVPAIAGIRVPLAAFAPQIADQYPEAGPLGGIQAALAASHAEWNIFLPVDMPLMPPALLARLLERAWLTGSAVTLSTLNGRAEPFPVVLNRSALPCIERRLSSGEGSCQGAWREMQTIPTLGMDAVAVESLLQTGQVAHPLGMPPVFWFQSANTPAQLAYLNRIASAARHASQGKLIP